MSSCGGWRWRSEYTASSVITTNIATYQPAANFHGPDGFTLQVTDGAGAQLATPAVVTITVTPVNDAPTVASAYGSGENDGTAIPVFVTVQDPDVGDTYTLSVVTPPLHGSVSLAPQLQTQSFAYTPATEFDGVDHFVFGVTDSGNATITATATVSVTFTPLPPPPAEKVELWLPTLRRAP